MKVNKNLSVRGCWKMVNAIQNAGTLEEMRERCVVAETWLRDNEVISPDEFNDLMMAVSQIHRETYHGFTLPDMWKEVNSDSDHGHFWKTECIRDYEHDCK